MKKAPLQILIVLGLVLLINFLGNAIYKRYDLTRDNRYTLSDETISLIEQLDERQRRALELLLRGKRALAVYHPYPVPIDALFEALRHRAPGRLCQVEIAERYVEPQGRSEDLATVAEGAVAIRILVPGDRVIEVGG